MLRLGLLGACLLAVGAPAASVAQPPASEVDAGENAQADEAAERPANGHEAEAADAPVDELAPVAADPAFHGPAAMPATPVLKNDDGSLEAEADAMGARAMGPTPVEKPE